MHVDPRITHNHSQLQILIQLDRAILYLRFSPFFFLLFPHSSFVVPFYCFVGFPFPLTLLLFFPLLLLLFTSLSLFLSHLRPPLAFLQDTLFNSSRTTTATTPSTTTSHFSTTATSNKRTSNNDK
ncbi:MAG: hypothetical protein JOS17DRAFT_550430 [Linnemannia elongata]|nr:MAG: hypothetical protein JOS17DRAFT_550430 [Linnemannia elongata]